MIYSKKVLSVILSAVMIQGVALASAISTSAYTTPTTASQTQTETDFEYTVSNDTVTITRYTGDEENVTVPQTINGKTVTAIGEQAFYSCQTVKNIILPNSIQTIEEWAFSWCANLTRITLSNQLTEIKPYAFSQTGALVSITIPDSVTKIGNNAFESSGIYEITIPDTVTEIGEAAFWECVNLETLPNLAGLTAISEDTFFGCEKLKNIIIPDNIKSIGQCAFCACKAAVDVVVPEGVTYLSQGAFSGCAGMKNITLPESLKTVGVVCFENCENIENVYYAGSKGQWNAIDIDIYYDANRWLENAEIHCNVGKAAEEISISDTELTLYVGDQKTLTTSRITGNTDYVWKSDSYYVTVNKAGRIVARESTGEDWAVKVYAKYKDGKAVACKVHILEKPVVTLDKTQLDMSVTGMYTLQPSVYPEDASVTYTFKSSNANVATVNKNGRVVARGEGTANITVTASNGAKTVCVVNVAPQKTVTLDKSTLELSVMEMYTLKPSVSPQDETATYTFKSSNTNVATVNKSGRVVARGEGTATITVIASNGAKATCTVTVIPQRTLTLESDNVTLALKEMYTIVPIMTPADESVTYTFKSNNTNVATVNKTGRVVARGYGVANITVKASNGLSKVCQIVVEEDEPVAQSIVYFNPSAVAKGDERWAVYTWNSLIGEQWLNMTEKDGLYQVTLPDEFTNYIIVRMNGSSTENNWNNKWNQSENLKYSADKNLITATGWGSGDKFNVTESAK